MSDLHDWNIDKCAKKGEYTMVHDMGIDMRIDRRMNMWTDMWTDMLTDMWTDMWQTGIHTQRACRHV